MELTAYHKYLLTLTGGDESLIAAKLLTDVKLDQNPQAFDLLSETGDIIFTRETCLKAAKLLIQKAQ